MSQSNFFKKIMALLRIIHILISVMEFTLELSDPVVMQYKRTM